MRCISVFFIGLFLFVSIDESMAQKVKGCVFDEDKIPLAYSSVSLMQSPDSVLTSIVMSDTTGGYEFYVKPGSYYVLYGFIGFEKSSSEVFELIEGQEFRVPDQLMKIQVKELDGVTITYKKPMIVKTARGLNVNVQDSPVLQSGNSKQVIEKIPGVIVNQDGSITLKGKSNVEIYIDGKRSFMSVENLMQWLESMPATDIEKIEVFDTPPAKYDASGSAGIINVILKKGAALGLNGRAGLNMGYGEFHKLSPSLSLNFRSRKYNAYGSAWSYNNKTFDIYKSDYGLPTSSGVTYFETSAKNIYEKSGFGGNGGIDFFLNKKNTIGLLFSGYSGGFNSYPNHSNTTISGENSYDYNFLDAVYDNDVYWNGQAVNLNFKHEFSKKEALIFDADLLSRNWGFDQNLTNNRYDNGVNVSPSILNSYSDTKVIVKVAKVDYEKELSNKVSFEAGLKGTLVNTLSNNTQNNTDELFGSNNKSSNQFEYDENVYAGYGSLIKKWKNGKEISEQELSTPIQEDILKL